MSGQRYMRRAISSVAIAAFSATCLFPVPRTAAQPLTTTEPANPEALYRLLAAAKPTAKTASDTGQTPVVRYELSSDGHLRLLAAPSGRGIAPARETPESPAQAARRFVTEHSAALGVTSEAVEYVSNKVRTRNDRDYVHMQQTYAGLPVFAAKIVVQLNPTRSIEFLLADIARDTSPLDRREVAVHPSITAENVGDVAQQYIEAKLGGEDLSVSQPRLMIFDSTVVAEAGEIHLVWEVFVSSETTAEVNEHLLIDAHDGSIVRHYPLNRDAVNREIYDASNTSADPGVLWRAEGDPLAGIWDVDRTYDYLGNAYQFFYIQFNRDSIDDNGMTLSATVRYCRSGSPCPYDNAFWRPGLFSNRFYFGQDYAVQDIIAHEYTHGVNSFESNLVYEDQSGAIEEFLADAFGEFIDQRSTDYGHDGASWNWQIGEDLPDGTVRNMQDPPNPPTPDVFDADCDYDGNLRQPDRMGSSYWYSGSCDRGGVHVNSGVGNKLCYLLTDGDTFNGQTIEGMGINDVAELFYEANTELLPSGADYADLGDVLQQTAVNDYWSTRHQNNLYRALKAVEIARSSDIYIDEAHFGLEFGTELFPYNTVTEGYEAALPGDRLRVKGGTYDETLTLRKIMKVIPRDGTVRIGA